MKWLFGVLLLGLPAVLALVYPLEPERRQLRDTGVAEMLMKDGPYHQRSGQP